jgi:uncharacterized protein YndB with AHSA1/START domain
MKGRQMAEVEGAREFGMTGDRLWALVADPARLADWVPTMRRAEPAGKEEVHLEGESHGHPYSLDSELRVDEDRRSLHWGAEAHDSYRGWLQVADLPSGSEVRMHVSVPDDRLGLSAAAAAAELHRGLEEAFDRLARLSGA